MGVDVVGIGASCIDQVCRLPVFPDGDQRRGGKSARAEVLPQGLRGGQGNLGFGQGDAIEPRAQRGGRRVQRLLQGRRQAA